jgi:carboxymethylenebutenolidase
MSRIQVDIPTADGRSPGSLHVPDGAGPWPGVLFFPDAGGLREVVRTMADRLSAMGYVVLVPDVFYRAGQWGPFSMETVFTDKAQRARMDDLVASLTQQRVVADSGSYLAFLLDRPEVRGSLAGTTGYCMGGRFSLIAAAAHPHLVGAAASFHGSRLAVAEDPLSPHRSAARITATVYVAGAVEDSLFTAEQAALLAASLTEAGVRHVVEFYPARHGFAVPDLPTYDEAAQIRHWAALDELYGTALG